MDAVVDAATLDAIEVPRDLCEIRAFVRWEEAGKPNETTEEWREAEFAAAVVDLKREVASGVTLNDIRRRYGQPIVDGDDEPWRGKTTETTRMGGEDARASDSRAPERERTKASRRSSVEGLTLIENFVTVDEERALATLAATSGDETRLARRRVKHFGYAFDYGTRDANLKVVDEIPELAMEVLRRLPRETPGYEGAMRCDQVTVNEYPRGVGLAPHVDTHSAFGDTILSLSLLGGTVMEFRTSGEAHRAIYLPPRSLLVMHGESRYRWQHYIPHRKFDTLEGEAAPTPRDDVRLSYTFRERRSGPCECAFPLQCDSRDGAQSKCSKRKTGKTQAFAELVGESGDSF